MKREDLTKLGIEDKKVVDKIMALHGKSTEGLKTKVGDAEVKAATDKVEIEVLQKQVKDAGITIEGFKNMDIEGVKKSASEWEEKAKKLEADAKAEVDKIRADGEKKVSDLKLDHAVEGALVKAKAKNPKAVRALLNTENLKLTEDGESVLGLEEQLKGIKTENEYLFETDEGTPKIVGSTKTGGVVGDAITTAARKAAGLADQEKGD